MHYYEVALTKYIGNTDSILTYSSEFPLAMGTVVSVPLRNKLEEGVICQETVKPKFTTRTIARVLTDKPVFDDQKFDLAKWISEYYLCSFGSVLNLFLPATLGKKRRQLAPANAVNTDQPKKLTIDQQQALDKILERPGQTHLLFGVTGSGKTEVYLQLLEKTLAAGKTAIVLVPEISLTPQTEHRFRARFGDKVAILHSHQKETERFANWNDLFQGTKSIALGPRSALFAPLRNVGLIIIDEEHESSYKQNQTPRYHAVDAAKKYSQITGATLVLGSATPSFENYFEAKGGNINLEILNKRIVQSSMPPVEIIDMRHEFKYGNKSVFSEKMQKEIRARLAENEQILLFVNRRGMSTFVSCRECGHVETCPNCDASLVFHYDNGKLLCHHCGYEAAPPVICPNCKSTAIKFFGTGTQKLEFEIGHLFPKSRVERMDSDNTKSPDSHAQIFHDFKDRKIDILIGTQMITKGWDLKNVGLVGILGADGLFNIPDYRTDEKAFQLLSQVAGRTGRGLRDGIVLLQTYNPDLEIFKFVVRHDYDGFFNSQLLERKELGYPPFEKLVKLLYNHKVQKTGLDIAIDMADIMRKSLSEDNMDAEVSAPETPLLAKINNHFRYQIIIKYTEEDADNIKRLIQKNIGKDWVIDIDPMGIS